MESPAPTPARGRFPLRESLQRAVNRVVYGRWHEPYEVLAGLGERLEAAADVDRLMDAVVTELTTGLDLADVSVRGLDGATVGGSTMARATAADGATVDATQGTGTVIPLQAFGKTVGYLAYRVPGRQLSDAEQRLLRDLARQLGGALHARLLREDLQRARERLVLAREEERRRLRRDLHDGIGPALAGLTLKTETARALLPRGSDRASRQLHDLSEEIRRTVVDVRRLVEGLRPPALDELGLSGACAQAVERLTAGADLSASVRVGEDLPTLPAAVEVAAYRIVVEAVTNTASVPDRPGDRRARDFHGGRRRQRLRRAGRGRARIRPQGRIGRRNHRGAAHRRRGRCRVRCRHRQPDAGQDAGAAAQPAAQARRPDHART
jgi:signal transduction histidine kinase